MKILVVLTGGTIGSIVKDNVINTTKQTSYRIIQLYNERYKDNIDFEVIQPINILSENLTKLQWKLLGEFLLKIDLSEYSGVIITHGSDTLAYSSVFIGILMKNIDKPIAITASNKVLDDKTANGMDNFRGCVQLIRAGINGVYTVYRNKDNKILVYNATRLREADLCTDEFSSWGEIFGEIYSDNLKITGDNHNLYKSFKEYVQIDFNNMKNVLLIKPYPSMDYDMFNLENVDTVVHTFYHSSTACIYGDNTNIINFITKCKNNNIKIYGCCEKKFNNAKYASADVFFNTKMVILDNVSPEEAYVRAVFDIL